MSARINQAAEEESHDTPPRLLKETESLSIYDIFRKHSRDRLFVDPLHWTSKHLALLECSFARTKAKLDGLQRSEFPEKLRNLASFLPYSYMSKRHAISGLVRDFNFGHCSTSCLSFHFGRSVVIHLDTDGVFSPVSPNTGPPRLAYLELDEIQLRRDKSIALPRGLRYNKPVISIQYKRRELVQPTKMAEDPYIAAVLIALAQAQYHQVSTPSTGIEVHLLATIGEGTMQRLYHYTALISPHFLDRLEQPSRRYPSSLVRITYFRIPLRPVEKMLQAMQLALSR